MKHALAPLTLLFTITFVISPAFTEPFSGFRADQLPIPQIDPPIQPAGYAFAIWGLIYAWLLVSAGYGMLRRSDDSGWQFARPPLIISLATGTPWLAIANTSAVWASIAIFIMAATAIIAFLRAPLADLWWLRVPLAIYAGWLTAASFVSLGSTAAGYGILTDALGWAHLGILATLIVAGYVAWLSKSLAYAFTVSWALVGIIVANSQTHQSVSALAAAGIGIILIVARSRRTIS